SYELEDVLEKSGKLEILDLLKDIRSMANIISIRQQSALGLGHAVLTAKPVVGDESFAVLLGDEIMLEKDGGKPVTGQLIENFDSTGQSVVAVLEVAKDQVSKYGIVALAEEKKALKRITS